MTIPTPKTQIVCLPVEILQAKLSPGALKALLGLLSFRNRQTGQCNPKIATLCERLGGASDRTVRRWLCELRQAGIVEATKQRGKQNSYRILCAVTNDRTEAPCAVTDDRTDRSQMTAHASVSLYELYEGNIGVRALKRTAAVPPENRHQNRYPPRKSIMSETLECYYRLFAPKEANS